MNTATLPDKLVDGKRRSLAQLGKGESGFIKFVELIVRVDRSCFVNLKAELQDEPHCCVEARRSDDDSFHVVIPSDIRYVPGKLQPRVDAELQPVASIAIGFQAGMIPM
jgi:hypothetical protein